MNSYSLKKKVVFILIVITISIFAAILCGEIYVRFFSKSGYITPEILKKKTLQYEPSLFARHLFPAKERKVYGWGDSGWHIRWFINEKGYRGHNFSVEKPKGTTRIIFYGGSGVFDPDASPGKDWPHRVENILRQSGFSDVEVISTLL